MLTAGVCPDFAQYKKLATGQLSSPGKEALLEHLEGCPACAERVDSLSDKDTLVDLIRQARTLRDGPAPETVARLVERARELRPSSDVAEKAPAQVRLACSGCGKSLKVKADLAGKKIKCPKCQAVTLAPNALQLTGDKSPRPPPSEVAEALTVAPASPAGGRNSAGTAAGAGQAPPAGTDQHLYDFLAPAQSPDELGRLGQYRVLRVLGAGGMGVVFQAEDPRLQRLIALKAMLPGLAASDSAKQRFLREARAAAALKHDHIVTIHQVDEDRGVPFLAMEFLEGEPLDDRLKREGKLPLTEVLRIGREIAEGLAAAHERGLIHRDIKPANVWLEGKKGRVKILDFGLARAATGEAHLTQSGAIVGTPAYMAPEQAQGKNLDPRADLFSLGCVLYRTATGEAPFRGADMISTLMAVATENPAPPVSLNVEMPAELSDLIMQLLAKKPEDRPESAQALAEILERMAHETPPRAAKAGAQQPGAGRRGRRFAIAAGASFFFAALTTAAIYFLWQTPNGIIRIEVSDPDIQVVLDKDGPTIKGVGKQDIKVTPGAHGLKIKRGDLDFETEGFVLRKGETITLKIEWLEEGKLQVVQAGKGVIGEMAPPIQAAKKETPPTEVAKEVAKNSATPFAVAPFNAAKAKEHQDAWAKHLGVPVEATNKIGMKLRLIPPGVWLTPAYYLGKYEVTQGEWEQVMGYNPSQFGPKNPNLAGMDTSKFPVDVVSWFDSVEYCNKLSELEGLKPYYDLRVTKWGPKDGKQVAEAEAKILGGSGYHLPTDAEWEHGCRAGTNTAYHFGDKEDDLPEYAWFDKNSANRTHGVGEKKPNAFGLYDMHGNVWEWTESLKAVNDTRRFLRGGSFIHNASGPRSANRAFNKPTYRVNNLGLRVARTLPLDGFTVLPPLVPPTLEEKEAKKLQEDWAAKLKLPVEATNDIEMKLRLIPPGDGVAKAFYLGKYEVTQGEWEEVMDYNPSAFVPTNARVAGLDTSIFPVESVSWYDCVEFCNKLSEGEGLKPYYELTVKKRIDRSIADADVKILRGSGYHIPTDAEWEHGCRAGTQTKYYCGDKDEDLLEHAWFDKNSEGRPHEVGEKKPNAFGLHDMHGNVREWTEEMLTNAAPERVLRGGSWAAPPGHCAVSNRYRFGPDHRHHNHGLRLARAAVAKESTPLVAEPLREKEAKKLQQDWAAKLKLPVEATNKIGMKLRLIPPRDGVANVYYLGKYEVTQKEWQEVMGYNPSDFSAKGGWGTKVVGLDTSSFPVEQVSWFDCVEFCNKLSEREGMKPYFELTVKQRKDGSIREAVVKILGGSGYHIPTVAEWHHGCRAGAKTKYHCGDDDEDLLEYAWINENSAARPHPVGEKKPNGFGLFDMHGNVREWKGDIVTDPASRHPEIRGGSYAGPASACGMGRFARRGPDLRQNDLGLRVARVP